MLLKRPGEVVTREEIREELWPDGIFVDFDEGLDTALKKLRRTLGDSAQNPIFIETIPRRGYRFIAPVSGNGQNPYVLPGSSAATLTDSPPKTIALRGHNDSPESARNATPRTGAFLKYGLVVARFVAAHGIKHRSRCRKILLEAFGKIGVNTLVLFFKRNSERQNLAF
jgi:DNA-binding winged helix-turn-helix (wHTH) protein